MSKLTPLDDDSFIEEIVQKKGVTFVDFWAPWCGPCRQFAPILDKIAITYEDRLRFYSVNTDESQRAAQALNVASIPTIVIFKDGEVIHQSAGVRNTEAMAKLLDEVLASV